MHTRRERVSDAAYVSLSCATHGSFVKEACVSFEITRASELLLQSPVAGSLQLTRPQPRRGQLCRALFTCRLCPSHSPVLLPAVVLLRWSICESHGSPTEHQQPACLHGAVETRRIETLRLLPTCGYLVCSTSSSTALGRAHCLQHGALVIFFSHRTRRSFSDTRRRWQSFENPTRMKPNST